MNRAVQYGFVYIWRDDRRSMFYIGSHHGAEDDGYTGSSIRFKRSIKKRPEDFRRRVIDRNFIDDPVRTRALEDVWLKRIKPDELGNKYYNLKRYAGGGNLYEGLSLEALENTRKKLRESRFSEKHHAARSVMIDGHRFPTKADAKRALGFDPSRRLASKSEKWRSWYYEDERILSVETCKNFDNDFRQKRQKHLERLGRLNSARSPEWHKNRLSKGAQKRRSPRRRFNDVARENMRKGQLGRVHMYVSIEKMREARREFWRRKKEQRT